MDTHLIEAIAGYLAEKRHQERTEVAAYAAKAEPKVHALAHHRFEWWKRYFGQVSSQCGQKFCHLFQIIPPSHIIMME